MTTILGISPLDKDSTACIVRDGCVLGAIAEERLSRQKLHAGFPYLALDQLLQMCGVGPEDIDHVVYSFLTAQEEIELIEACYRAHKAAASPAKNADVFKRFRSLPAVLAASYDIPGLSGDALHMHKPWYKSLCYKLASTVDGLGSMVADRSFRAEVGHAAATHRKYAAELLAGLDKYGLTSKLVRIEHQEAHAFNAYFTSGFDEALIFTADGYGSGLAGSVSVGRDGKVERLHGLRYPASLGEFYERVTSSLGFRPTRHAGKIVGLAAHGDPMVLYETVKSFFDTTGGDIKYKMPFNIFFSRYLADRYSKPVVAAAYQKVLEDVGCEYIAHYLEQTGINSLVLSGGIFANVKANQRLFELPGVDHVFVHPNMGDGGCSVGGALAFASRLSAIQPSRVEHVYWGCAYSEKEMAQALDDAKLEYERVDDIEKRIAELLAEGNIVARFNGAMEYGPRALGNRSILYHAKDPSVNQWLNEQLMRTEFMPFAPATLYEERAKCYKNIEGAEYPAEFMTITFDCTDLMREQCPAAVHVDGTARPQLVRKETNASFHRILGEYHRITGIPSIINTSFNLHEEPIVCSPADAVRAFQRGHLPYLAMGPCLVTASSS